MSTWPFIVSLIPAFLGGWIFTKAIKNRDPLEVIASLVLLLVSVFSHTWISLLFN